MFVIQDSYYHALGYLIDPLDLLITFVSVQELQLVSGVCRICVGAVRSTDPRGGRWCGRDTRHGVPG